MNQPMPEVILGGEWREIFTEGKAAKPVHDVEGVPVIVLPDGDGEWRHEVVDVEKHLANPRRKRGSVVVRDVASFIAYVKRHQTESTIAAATDEGDIVAVLDHHAPGPDGEAGWGEHSVQLHRPRTTAFKAWVATDRKPLTQVQFAEFLEERIGEIVAPDGADLIRVAQTFTASKKINFSQAHRLDNGQMQAQYVEELEGGASGAGGTLQVPTAFDLLLQPYRDSESFPISAALRWRLNEGRLTFTFLLSEVLEQRLEEIHDEAIDEVESATGVTVLRGSLR